MVKISSWLQLCIEKMWNVGMSFPGNIAFGGKSLQFWREIHNLDGYFYLFLTSISEKLFKKKKMLTEIFDHIPRNSVWFRGVLPAQMHAEFVLYRSNNSKMLPVQVNSCVFRQFWKKNLSCAGNFYIVYRVRPLQDILYLRWNILLVEVILMFLSFNSWKES